MIKTFCRSANLSNIYQFNLPQSRTNASTNTSIHISVHLFTSIPLSRFFTVTCVYFMCCPSENPSSFLLLFSTHNNSFIFLFCRLRPPCFSHLLIPLLDPLCLLSCFSTFPPALGPPPFLLLYPFSLLLLLPLLLLLLHLLLLPYLFYPLIKNFKQSCLHCHYSITAHHGGLYQELGSSQILMQNAVKWGSVAMQISRFYMHI